jgi:cytochrome c-type biogenesis protein CcmH/NrfG
LLEEAAEAYRQGAVEQALGLARKAAGLGGGARARIVAGRMLVHEGRLREAEVEFAAALRLAPDNAEAAAWLARTHAEVR